MRRTFNQDEKKLKIFPNALKIMIMVPRRKWLDNLKKKKLKMRMENYQNAFYRVQL